MCVCVSVCVCVSEEPRGGVKSKVRGVKKYHKGLSGREPAFSQDLV